MNSATISTLFQDRSGGVPLHSDGPNHSGGADGDQNLPELSWPGCFVWMTLLTLGISLLSQWIVDAIEVSLLVHELWMQQR